MWMRIFSFSSVPARTRPNRTSTKAGGDQSGSGLRPASYTANSLNQYTSRTVPNGFDVLGLASVSSSVTVNSSAADYRRGEYFQELLGMNNTSTSVWQSVTVTTSGGGTNTGNIFVPAATESYGYDADGNTTNDGRRTFTWDGENRLISMQAISSVPTGAKKKLDFAYDYQGRRIQKIVSTWNGSAYVAASTNKFLYDGWNLIAELNSTNGIVRSYIWGLDLSGTIQGAGGVGGLLAIKPTSSNPIFVAYDGNGNVNGLIDAATGTTSGQFEYGPFGETIRLTPNANNQSPFRFSTKYTDDESDFLYYGYRYYNPSTGRWLSRDPIGENGGINTYCQINNDTLNSFDVLGFVPGDPERNGEGPLGLFMRFLLRKGNNLDFPGYSQSVWDGILSLDVVDGYVSGLERRAKEIAKCCEETSVPIDQDILLANESFFDLGQMRKTLPAGLSIGSGSLVVQPTKVNVKCDGQKCSWEAAVTFNVFDIYTFKPAPIREPSDPASLQTVKPRPLYNFDSNLPLRLLSPVVFLGGQDYSIYDSRKRVFRGSMPCHTE